MGHLQRASDSRHIAATYSLGLYYEHNQTFNSSEKTNSIENLNGAIHYYTKTVQMIKSTSNYPEGATEDMKYIESTVYTSYYVFKKLPNLYFDAYAIAIRNIINSSERVSYTDTLDVLNNMRITAILCLERPSLAVWKRKRDIIYEAQQTRCNAFLSFTEAVYPVERQRIQAAKQCTALPSECVEHKGMINQINRLAGIMFSQVHCSSCS